jgi:hypothetical protein
MAADDVQLPDLEVIQRFSLAVRPATAPRAEVVAALESDLAWLSAAPTAAAPPPGDATPTTAPAELAPPRKRSPRKVARSPRTPRPTSTSASDPEA